MLSAQTRSGGISLAAALFLTAIWPARAFQQPANPGDPSTLEDFKAGDANREKYQRATAVLKALHVSQGDWVADVGAGAGYYSMRLSYAVGPTGKVFAEEIFDAAIGWLNQRAAVFNLRNMEVVKGVIDNPKLPANALSAVLIVNAYHHFSRFQAMDEQILRSLKPGGRLVIADYSLPAHRLESRADQVKIHEIDPALVRAELGRVGFHVLKCDDPFLKRIPEAGKDDRIGAADMWLMIAILPN